jgi:protein-L-isoaspartate(D-aspartate) O-methyltransferase
VASKALATPVVKNSPPVRRPGFPAQLPLGPNIQKGVVQRPDSLLMFKPNAPSAQQTARPQGLGLDSSVVRQRMVDQLRARGDAGEAVLNALGHIPRHLFVDSAFAPQAYEDTSLPIGQGQTISKPSVVARMIDLLLNGQQRMAGRILEIGTGCGYQAAVLSKLCAEVYSIERIAALHEKARLNLRHLRLPNLHLLLRDGMLGYAPGAPYTGIISAAGGQTLPQAWVDQLAVGGRLIAPTQTSTGEQALWVVDKTTQGLRSQVLEAVHFVPLKSGVL